MGGEGVQPSGAGEFGCGRHDSRHRRSPALTVVMNRCAVLILLAAALGALGLLLWQPWRFAPEGVTAFAPTSVAIDERQGQVIRLSLAKDAIRNARALLQDQLRRDR